MYKYWRNFFYPDFILDKTKIPKITTGEGVPNNYGSRNKYLHRNYLQNMNQRDNMKKKKKKPGEFPLFSTH